MEKKRIAVFFGGRSPEHDVSVISGLQVLQALDQTKYEAFPVYITTDGKWLVGDILRDRANYLLDKNAYKKVTEVTLDVTFQDNVGKKGALLAKKSMFFSSLKVEEFDVAIPVFHGLYGEDGNIQGLFELAGIPYTGMRTMASSILMDKVVTKHMLRSLGIPYLPYAKLKRPDEGYLIPKDKLSSMLRDSNIDFPCIIKPSHLGSSIGVAKVDNIDELGACLPAIFEMDDSAIIEPFVQNLVEYNVAVSKISGDVETSAIERPKAVDELLDFKQKYLSGGDNKTGTKNSETISEGMLSLTRELNPKLEKAMEEQIITCSKILFEAIDGSGAPRIDYIGDFKTGDIWLNEVNPCPGSFGYFLWEAAEEPLLFSDFLSGLIEEALFERQKRKLLKDPVPAEARLLRRRLG
ncbi:MAG: D-alanine--D-alanine ligase [Alphaproteobacteria bacterium]|nr:D-alanine--D-alanine ligase [Alphaproteobacteria bacterium]